MKSNSHDEQFNRTPPHNLEAEKSVVGSMMLVNSAIDDVLPIVRAEHFYNNAYHIIFATIIDMFDRGIRGIDPVTIGAELEKKGTLEEVGGLAALVDILEAVPHAAHCEYYAKIVREKWLERTLIYACNDVLKDVYTSTDPIEDVLSRSEQKIFQIAEQQESIDKVDIKSILIDAWDRINERQDNEGTTTGLTTGFRDLDDLTSGFQPSELIIMAARPSMGKTAFVCNVALAMAKSQKGVLLFSLEQSNLELAERFLCIHAKVNGHKVRQGNLDEMERFTLMEASNELSQLPLYIDDVAGRTMTQIAAVTRRLARYNNVSCVIIDYLQLIEAEDKNQPREQQISGITRRLKFLAKDMRMPVIALSQLNRGVEQREDKRPRLADLRESGAIEQDADVIMFLHRPEAYNPEDEPGVAYAIIAKNRSGPIDSVKLTWVRESLRFADYSPMAAPGGDW
jgi:replicative DNA helicase